MTEVLKSLELRFSVGIHGLSARRLWEHTELGQRNVHNHVISARPELNDARRFIDVVWFAGDTFSLAGLTLDEFLANKFPRNWLMSNNVDMPPRRDDHPRRPRETGRRPHQPDTRAVPESDQGRRDRRQGNRRGRAGRRHDAHAARS